MGNNIQIYLEYELTLPPSLANRTPTGEIRIGLLSDTHICNEELPLQFEQVFADVDLILHAGDIIYPRVLDELEHMAPVLAARGDEDSDGLADDRIKESHFLKLGGLSLWLVWRRSRGNWANTC